MRWKAVDGMSAADLAHRWFSSAHNWPALIHTHTQINVGLLLGIKRPEREAEQIIFFPYEGC
jgi:hypothetical protein